MVHDRGGRTSDLVAAAGQRPGGLVLDGELVVWDPAIGRLSFQALQHRRPRPQRPGPGRPVVGLLHLLDL
ncbi:hypothetical protein ACIBTP_39030 [Streptomyces avidinii]|uniref:hypothetical protein n=1 Tax=Streptomyces avidinii TaxID=1895 RepID=UPI0037B70D74